MRRQYSDATVAGVAVAARIDCMECGGDAYLAQPIGPEDVVEAGDVLVYLCGACAQRWDVVVDEADIVDETDTD